MKPKSPWPKSFHQRHLYCTTCSGDIYKTVELRFDSGSVLPVAGETLTGATSADTGVVVSVALESGTWAGGTAAGTVYLSSPTGIGEDGECFDDDETVNGSTGGTNILTANGDGITKSEGMPYPEGAGGYFEGRFYCSTHLNFMLGRDKYNYRLGNLGD